MDSPLPDGDNDQRPAVLRTGWYVFDRPNGAYPYSVRLPLRPLWLGMAANSIFYGAIIAAVVSTPGLIRSAIRARRTRAGVCPCCRYPRSWETAPTRAGSENRPTRTYTRPASRKDLFSC